MVAERNGWQIVQEFVDQGISGAKGREQRPAFDALWKGAIRREFDSNGMGSRSFGQIPLTPRQFSV